MIGSGRRIRTCHDLINSQAHPPRAVDRNKLVDRLGVEPSASCLQGISPLRRPAQRKRVHACLLETKARSRASFRKMVLGRGFEPRSPALQAGAFTRLAFRALVRPARIELASSERHSEALPIDQGRMVESGRNRTSCPKGLRLQRSDGTSLSLLHFPYLMQ